MPWLGSMLFLVHINLLCRKVRRAKRSGNFWYETRVQFVKKMGMLNSKLRKSMWQIRTASGSVEEVFRENLDLIAFNFNKGID